MIFQIRVTLTGIKGFYRVYQVNGATTLYTLHKQLRSDLEFPQDQLIMFKALDAGGGLVARYGLFDLGSGTVDQTSLEKAVKAGAASFVYFYDVTNRKSVNILVEGELEGLRVSPDFPVLADTKGPNPIEFENGYVAFEDLPERQRVKGKTTTMTWTKTWKRKRRRKKATTKTARKSTTRTNKPCRGVWRLYWVPPLSAKAIMPFPAHWKWVRPSSPVTPARFSAN